MPFRLPFSGSLCSFFWGTVPAANSLECFLKNQSQRSNTTWLQWQKCFSGVVIHCGWQFFLWTESATTEKIPPEMKVAPRYRVSKKELSFTEFSISRFVTNITSISSQLEAGSPNAQFGKTQFFWDTLYKLLTLLTLLTRRTLSTWFTLLTLFTLFTLFLIALHYSHSSRHAYIQGGFCRTPTEGPT